LHANVYGGNGTYDYDVITSVPSTYSVDNTSSLYVCGTSAVRSASQWFSHRLFNRAKTVAENLAMFVNGIASADVGASQTAVYTSDFSAGADSWTATNSSADGNIDGIDGEDNCLRMTISTTGTGRRINRTITQLNIGQMVQITGRVYWPVTNVNFDSFTIANGAAGNILSPSAFVTNGTKGVWQSFSFIGPCLETTTSIRFYAGNSAPSTSSTTEGGDIMYLKDIQIKKVGITSELLAQNAQTDNGQVLDSSGNKQHAKLAEAGMSTQGAISARRREVRWTNTWAGTNELQYIGGVNQAILPANAYIESIVGTVSGATPHDIIVGDGSDTDRYVTITTGLAAGTTSFTVAARTTDGTNLKLTVDPDTDATMSIAWVITYYRLES
jgi:hypothetical protein